MKNPTQENPTQKNPTQWKALVPGLSLTVVLAVLAWFCGHRVPIVGAPVFGILFRMLVALFVNSPALREGTRLASKKLLQLASNLVEGLDELIRRKYCEAAIRIATDPVSSEFDDF